MNGTYYILAPPGAPKGAEVQIFGGICVGLPSRLRGFKMEPLIFDGRFSGLPIRLQGIQNVTPDFSW